jgi:nonsense-mediated mRNA decay protein 3
MLGIIPCFDIFQTSHKKTFLYLEQLILKHNAHGSVLRIKERPGGLDFYYGQKQDARKLVDFIMSVVPSKYKTSQELISHDVHSNTYNYKFTFAVEIVPVCKDNIVCLPRKLAQSLGNISPIVHCSKVTSYLQVIDPMTLQGEYYYRHQYSAL